MAGLAACSSEATRPAPQPLSRSMGLGQVGARSRSAPSPPTALAALPAHPSRYGSVDEYKALVARQINNANPGATFSGQLPPLLPAIVVVSVAIDRNGNVASVSVVRSRDDQASQVATVSVKIGAPYPRPHNLIADNESALNFSETFLFNEDYRFQLRSLAGPQ